MTLALEQSPRPLKTLQLYEQSLHVSRQHVFWTHCGIAW